MNTLKITSLASAITFSLLLTGCGSDSDSNNVSSSNGNEDNIPTTVLPPEGVNVTADNTFQVYSFSYNLGGEDESQNFLTRTLDTVRAGNLISSTDTVVVAGNGNIDDDDDDDDSEFTILSNNFQYVVRDDDTQIGIPFYGLTTDYLTLRDDSSNKSIIYKVGYDRIDLSGVPINSREYATPLAAFENPNNLNFPSGSTCWAQTTTSWSDNVYLTNFNDISDFTSVEEWRNAGFNIFYNGVASDLVGTNNQYAAYRLTDDETGFTYPALIESNSRFYNAGYIPRDISQITVGDCERYNKVAADYISQLIKDYYNR